MSKFIVLEGTDGSGKATQLELLCRALDARGMAYTRLSFPQYDSPAAAPLKMYLNGDFGTDPQDVNPYAASTFFSVDRYASFKRDWAGAYEKGDIILADRYTTSNAIHQAGKLEGEAREAYLKWLFDFEYGLLGLPAPDRVVFLDMPARLSFQLIRKRQGEQGDIHEKNHAYLEKCRANALDVCRKYGWIHINCADGDAIKSPERIHGEILAAVGGVLGLE